MRWGLASSRFADFERRVMQKFAISSSRMWSIALLSLACTAPLGAWAQAGATVKITLVASADAEGQNGLGDEVQIMTQAVIDEYNDTQKGGPTIDLQVLDSQGVSEAKLAQEATGSAAIISCVGQSACLLQAKVAKSLGIPLLGPMTGDMALRDKAWAGTVLPVRPSNAEALKNALRALSTMRVKKLGVLVQNDAYGKDLEAVLAAQKLPEGLELAVKETIDPKTAWAPLTQRLQTAGVTAVLLLSDHVPTANALVSYWNSRRKTAAAYTPTMMHLDGLALPEYAEKAAGYPGGSMFVTIVPSPWGGRRQAQRDYQALAQSKGIYRASYGSFEAFLNARVLVNAVRNGKATTASKISQYLHSSNSISLGGLSLRYVGDKNETTGFLDQAVLGGDGSFRH
jgi:ABC-type branched-subunit amino acid transport system substrate-binding protein